MTSKANNKGKKRRDGKDSMLEFGTQHNNVLE